MWIIFWGHHKIGLYLGVKVKVLNGGIFFFGGGGGGRGSKISNIFFFFLGGGGCLKFLIYFSCER